MGCSVLTIPHHSQPDRLLYSVHPAGGALLLQTRASSHKRCF